MEVFPIKVSKDKKIKYFNLSMQNDKAPHRVCFSLEKHRLLIDIDKDSANSGIEFKRFRSRDNKNDIIVNDFTSVKKTEVNFERKIL